MEANDQIFTTFTTRMRQLILQYKETLREKGELLRQISDRAEEIKRLNAQIVQMQRDYESLKMAKMLEVTDGDLEMAKARISKILRDINRCITYLNEK